MTTRTGLFSVGGRPLAGILKQARLKIATFHRFVFGIILNQLSDCDQCLIDMDDDERVAIIEQPDDSMLAIRQSELLAVIRQSELLAMAGPAESVLMPKVPSQHLLPMAQENSRNSDGLFPSMCG
jgi:hypothetical protein